MRLIMLYQFSDESNSSYKTGDKEFEIRFGTEYFTDEVFVRPDFIEHLLPVSKSEIDAVLKTYKLTVKTHYKLILVQGERWISGHLVKAVLGKLVSSDNDRSRMLEFLDWYTDIEETTKCWAKLHKYTGVTFQYSEPGVKW